MATGVTVIAALVRLVGLGYPKALVFDEVYYARGAYSLLALGYEGDWGDDKEAFVAGDYADLSTRGDYVVHPMVGKLLIAAGIKIFGETPFGWRSATAIFGIATVLIVALLARSMLRSTLWGGLAGLLLALDGESIVMSRTALLDNFLTFFVVAGLALLWLDRRRVQRILAARGPDWRPNRSPRTGIRWWRLLAIVSFGLACGTKWSGAYFAAAFLLMSVAWEAIDRRKAGYRLWLGDTFWRSALPGMVASVIIVPVVYVATWANWFLTSGSYNRDWASRFPDTDYPWIPDALRSLWYYHSQMLSFHSGLTSDHNYESHPSGWIIQFRPTAFRWQEVTDVDCGADRCISAIGAIGTPVLWWAGLAAMCFAIWRLFLRRDPLGFWMSIGIFAAWLPWMPLAHRTVFTFYSVAMAPFVVLVLVWALARIAKPPELGGRWSFNGGLLVGWYMVLVIAVSAFFLPVWTGDPVPYDYWHAHMWLPSW